MRRVGQTRSKLHDFVCFACDLTVLDRGANCWMYDYLKDGKPAETGHWPRGPSRRPKACLTYRNAINPDLFRSTAAGPHVAHTCHVNEPPAQALPGATGRLAPRRYMTWTGRDPGRLMPDVAHGAFAAGTSLARMGRGRIASWRTGIPWRATSSLSSSLSSSFAAPSRRPQRH